MKKGAIGKSGKFYPWPKKVYPYTFWLWWVWIKV